MMTGERERRLLDWVVLGALLVLAGLIYGRVFDIRPFGEDNFYILSWVDRSPASALLSLDPHIYPEWRPLAFQSVWLQYQWAGLDRITDYYIVNIALWAIAAWLVYRVVLRLVPSAMAACAAALFVLIDSRSVSSIAWIVDRQSSMACVFGLFGVLMVVERGERSLSRAASFGLALLLLASALSKEYGLAFSGALLAYALLTKRRGLVAPALAAGVGYFALRFAFAGGGVSTYCGDLGYFWTVRKGACYAADASSVAQMAYNVAATAIGSLVRGLFIEDGRIGVARLPLVMSLFWLGLTVAGWTRGPRAVVVTGLMVAANTALSFLLYQPRNQLVAVCGAGIAVGVGIAMLSATSGREAVGRWRRTALTAALFGLLAIQAVQTRRIVGVEVDQLNRQDPCRELAEHPEAASFARRVKSRFGDGGDCGPVSR